MSLNHVNCTNKIPGLAESFCLLWIFLVISSFRVMYKAHSVYWEFKAAIMIVVELYVSNQI